MIRCCNCRRSYPETGVSYRCPKCGGMWDFDEIPAFDPAKVDRELPGIWRYRHTFGLPEEAPVVSLGEGNTSLVWVEAFNKRLAFKLEFLNPTGSFKDRGSAVLVSFVASRGVKSAVEDSSGNAGASFAAYAARAGLKGRVYMPETASGPKRNQIEAYGADVVSVPGPRSNAAEAVIREAEEGVVYASHAYLPFNLPGYASTSYEIWEQIKGAPGSVITPAGQGGLLLGIQRGFMALCNTGLIERVPVLVGVQARACAPLWAAAKFGLQGLSLVSEAQTLAEGIRVKYPLRGDVVIEAVESSGGMFVVVDEEAILPGRDQLAQRGLYVEPTSAVVWDALSQVVGQLPEPIVVILTGSGLKYNQQ